MNQVIIVFKNSEKVQINNVYAISIAGDGFVINYTEDGVSKYLYPASSSIALLTVT